MPDLPAYFEGRLVGTFAQARQGLTFAYAPSWLSTAKSFPVSTTMPLARRAHPAAVATPWVMNLLPEEGNLAVMLKGLGLASTDILELLARIGLDTAGALSMGRPVPVGSGEWRRVRSQDELERMIEDLPRKPLLADEDGVSISLAGAQAKMGVALDAEGRIHIPLNGAPSTHILKPDDTKVLYGGVFVEAYCMTLARLVGLPVAEVGTGVAGKRSFVLVRRYDRTESGGTWRRRHQEDLLQAIGLPPQLKYQKLNAELGRGGPGLADLFDAVRRTCGAGAAMPFLDMVAFNVLVCNTDAHAKNYSLMLGASGARLAPLYDVLNAAVFDRVTRNLAQKVAGKDRADHLKGRHWQRMAVECGLDPVQVLVRVQSMARRILDRSPAAEAAIAAIAAMPTGRHPMIGTTRRAVELTARSVLAGLGETEPAPGPYEGTSAEPGPMT